MLTQPLSVLVRQLEESAKKTDALMKLREERRKDPNWKGCDFCFGVGCGVIGDSPWVPCPDCNGLCA